MCDYLKFYTNCNRGDSVSSNWLIRLINRVQLAVLKILIFPDFPLYNLSPKYCKISNLWHKIRKPFKKSSYTSKECLIQIAASIIKKCEPRYHLCVKSKKAHIFDHFLSKNCIQFEELYIWWPEICWDMWISF